MRREMKLYKYMFKWREKDEGKWHSCVGVGTFEQCESVRREYEMNPLYKGFKVFRLTNSKSAYLPY